MYYKLGSLFDGSGGFPLAGTLCGITPVWASEVEPYPVAVTRSRFPYMKHYGDVSKIDGAEVEPVDIITFGSPCQDLSVAGKRAGLKHENNGDDETTRSGLFMEAIRIIKEMREATGGEYPSFAIWENVPGAFSSNKGEDFRIVLEEFIKIKEPSAEMPTPGKTGWAYADCYVGDGWSVAYRTFDAQHWGVPQRRRRIYLVADFRGERAGEILFKRDSLRGYFEEGRTPWQGIARNVENRTGTEDCNVICFEPGITKRDGSENRFIAERCSTLRANMGDNQPAVCYAVENHPADSRVNLDATGKVQTLTGRMGTGGGNVPMVLEAPVVFDGANITHPLNASNPHEGDPCHTLSTDSRNYVVYESHPQDSRVTECGEVSPTVTVKYAKGAADTPLVCRENIPYQDVTGPLMANSHPGSYSGQDAYTDMFVVGKEHETYALQGSMIGREDKNGPQGDGVNKNVCFTLNTIDRHAVCAKAQTAYDEYTETNTGTTLKASGGNYGGGTENIVTTRYTVRRLTPTECARLQGFPDFWGHITPKDDFTDEEYVFWLDVRNNHATLNGKTKKFYTKAQILNWYNKLHTDGSEYKMWGNGIALPNALYVMQGIADAIGKPV